MNKLILSILTFSMLVVPAYGDENCAVRKNEEFNALLEKIEEIDLEMAMEARNAYGMVSNYETFDNKEEPCFYMDRLLKDMRETVELYK